MYCSLNYARLGNGFSLLSSTFKATYALFPQLSVKGYNDKQHILLKKIIEKMATFEIDEKRFEIIKEAVSCMRNSHFGIIEN